MRQLHSHSQTVHRLRLSRVYRPTKHIIGHFGDGFCGSNDPTNSVKALKEVVVLRTGFNPTRPSSPCCKPTHAYNTQWYTIQKCLLHKTGLIMFTLAAASMPTTHNGYWATLQFWSLPNSIHAHTHTHNRFCGPFSGTIRVSRCQKRTSGLYLFIYYKNRTRSTNKRKKKNKNIKTYIKTYIVT